MELCPFPLKQNAWCLGQTQEDRDKKKKKKLSLEKLSEASILRKATSLTVDSRGYTEEKSNGIFLAFIVFDPSNPALGCGWERTNLPFCGDSQVKGGHASSIPQLSLYNPRLDPAPAPPAPASPQAVHMRIPRAPRPLAESLSLPASVPRHLPSCPS